MIVLAMRDYYTCVKFMNKRESFDFENDLPEPSINKLVAIKNSTKSDGILRCKSSAPPIKIISRVVSRVLKVIHTAHAC